MECGPVQRFRLGILALLLQGDGIAIGILGMGRVHPNGGGIVRERLTELELQRQHFGTAEGSVRHALRAHIARRCEQAVEERPCVYELPSVGHGVCFTEEDMVSRSRSQALDEGVIGAHPGRCLADFVVEIQLLGVEKGIEELQHLWVDALAGDGHVRLASGDGEAAPLAWRISHGACLHGHHNEDDRPEPRQRHECSFRCYAPVIEPCGCPAGTRQSPCTASWCLYRPTPTRVFP